MALLVLDGVRGTASSSPRTYPEFVAKVYRPMAERHGVIVPPLGTVIGEPLAAVVNANRWIVHCPTCNGAEFAWKDWPLFLCATCWNGADEHAFRPVVFPAQWEAIERVLMARPVPDRRNWSPGESVADLVAENVAHGLPTGVN